MKGKVIDIAASSQSNGFGRNTHTPGNIKPKWKKQINLQKQTENILYDTQR